MTIFKLFYFYFFNRLNFRQTLLISSSGSWKRNKLRDSDDWHVLLNLIDLTLNQFQLCRAGSWKWIGSIQIVPFDHSNWKYFIRLSSLSSKFNFNDSFVTSLVLFNVKYHWISIKSDDKPRKSTENDHQTRLNQSNQLN